MPFLTLLVVVDDGVSSDADESFVTRLPAVSALQPYNILDSTLRGAPCAANASSGNDAGGAAPYGPWMAQSPKSTQLRA
jgi:hypothetical protein